MSASIAKPTTVEIKSLLLQSFTAALITALLFGSTFGVVLDGYDFYTRWPQVATLAGVVFVGKMLLGLLGHALRIKPKASSQVSVPMALNKVLNKVLNKSQLRLLFGVSTLSLVVLPFFCSNYWLGVLILALIYVLLGLGLNIVVGLSGLLDLGFVAFYAVGAYGYALTAQYWGFGFWTALVFAACLAGLCGALLGFPVLRLHGDYLAIVTLGFGEIIHLVLTNWVEFTGGPNGVAAPAPTFFGLEFARRAEQGGIPFHEFFGIDYDSSLRFVFTYLALLAVVFVVTYVVMRLKSMPIGRAWEALRENEIACKALGINHVTVKLSAFSMGAFIGGLAGVFYAGYQRFVDPLSFNFFESALILAIVVLGGMGSTAGVIIAAVIITLTPEILREFADYRTLVFGILMVSMMIWRPRGLVRSKRQEFNLDELAIASTKQGHVP